MKEICGDLLPCVCPRGNTIVEPRVTPFITVGTTFEAPGSTLSRPFGATERITSS